MGVDGPFPDKLKVCHITVPWFGNASAPLKTIYTYIEQSEARVFSLEYMYSAIPLPAL